MLPLEHKHGCHKVYLLTFDNDKKYIGYTSKKINERLRNHDTVFKYGKPISVNILGKFKNRLDGLKAEVYYINELNTFKNGLNKTKGGDYPSTSRKTNKAELKQYRDELYGTKTIDTNRSRVLKDMWQSIRTTPTEELIMIRDYLKKYNK